MKNTIHHILWVMISLLAMVGCDVHEIPMERNERVPFSLHLDYDTELPFYKEIIYSRSDQKSNQIPSHDVRYIVNAYRTDLGLDKSRQVDTTFVFTHADINSLDCTLPLELREGTYTFKVWTDFVAKGSQADQYYNTSDFSEIILSDKNNHSGSNDYRDAFRGTATATILNPAYYTGSILNTIDNQARVEMKRPMGKFKFISTDLEIFLTRVAKMLEEEGIIDKVHSKATYEELLKIIELNDYEIVFRYNVFMPCSFNMFTDKPADSWMGMSFKSLMHNENNKEITLGFDYVFVNGTETTLSISVEVYDKNGNQLSASNPINVPIARSKLTVVRGDFLTSITSGGVAINPDYDGPDYNIEIQ